MTCLAEATLSDLMARVLRPRDRISVDEWADRHWRIAASVGAESGPWRTDRTPYLRKPMREYTNPRVDELTITFASQTGKTSAIECMIGRTIDADPCPIMYVWPNQDVGAKFNQERFTPGVMESPRLRGLLRAPAGGSGHRQRKGSEVKACEVYFEGGLVEFLGSNSKAHVRGKSRKYCFIDDIEAPEFDQSSIEDVRQRRGAWPGGKLVKISVPGLQGRGIDAELRVSRLHRYWVPCPHEGCGEFQALRWPNVKWEGGAAPTNADRARLTAFYTCEHCGAAIHEHHKAGMIRAGVWVADGQRVEKAPSEKRKAQSENEGDGHVAGITLLDGYRIVGEPVSRSGRHVGFTLSALYSPWVKWGDLAYEWCAQAGEPSQEWINGKLAEAWAPRGDKVDADFVMRLCLKVPDAERDGATAVRIARESGAYRLGEIPPGVLVLTGAIDLQRDRGYAEIVGWSERCQEAWLLWFTTFECPHEDEITSFRALERIVNMRLPMDDPNGKTGVKVSRWAVDSGDGVRTKDVYRFARLHPGRVFACKGLSGDMAGTAKKVALEKFPDGTVIPGGLTLFEVNTWKMKGLILGKLKQKPVDLGQGGRARVDLDVEATGGGVGGRWWWPDPDTDVLGQPVRDELAEYFGQMTAEHLIIDNPEAVKKGRRPVYRWALRPGRKNNHFLDCRVYNAALAEHEFGLLTEEYVDAWRRRAAGGGTGGVGAVKAEPETRGASGGGGGGGGVLGSVKERWRGRGG